MKLARFVIAVGLALAFTHAPAAAADPWPLRIDVEQPRAFGWRLGDLFERRVTLDIPQGLVLDESSLPKVNKPGGVAELRAIERTVERIEGGERLRLVLRYQLFISPVEPRVLELPGFRMLFNATGADARSETALVESWPIATSPLAPRESPTRAGLGELRPDAMLPAMPPPRLRLLLWAALAALLLGYLTHVYLGDRWWARRHRPFARAYRELARLDLSGGTSLQPAFRRLHRAFDEAAGRATFAADACSFAADGSRWAPLRADIASFFERSRAAFFDGTPAATGDGAQLLALARALRDAERGG
jgi:mxaA protein